MAVLYKLNATVEVHREPPPPSKDNKAGKGTKKCKGSGKGKKGKGKKGKKGRQPYKGSVDRFVANMEGGQRAKGYIPKDKSGKAIGQSGTTAATGVDLGQMNQKGLENLKLDKALEDKLKPYLGLKKDAAIEYLDKHPLNLTKEEADQLDGAVRGQHRDNLVSKYDKAIDALAKANPDKTYQKFNDLPKEAQAAIESAEYQYGSLKHATPNYWKAVTNQDWNKAVKELRNFGDAYSNRRNNEADIMERMLQPAAPAGK